MTPAALVRAVAKAIDVPESVMIQHDRRLAEAGLRTTGGRGASTRPMTMGDAGKLILAGMSLDRGDYGKTVAIVDGLWNATLQSDSTMPRTLRASFPALSQVIDNPKAIFGDALTKLLWDCADGNMERFFEAYNGEGDPFCLELMPEFWGIASLKFAAGKGSETVLEFWGHTTGVAAVRVSIYRLLAKPLIEIAALPLERK